MPNPLAYLMLAIWPLVTLLMFRRMSVERALIWSILGGYLFLPPLAEFNLPLVPSMDKTSIPALSAALVLVFAMGKRFALLPQAKVARLLVLVFVLGAIPTVLTNRDPLFFEVLQNSDPVQFVTGFLPGLNIRDIGSVLIGQAITLLPFLLARQFLATATGLREMLVALVIGGLIYSVPSLIEIRVSPQINIWVYGFFQHSFEQMMRDGGFRPIVFLPHGLWLALFVLMTLVAAAALFRQAEGQQRVRLMMVTGYLAVLLVLCKSLASMMYGVALVPLVLFASPKAQIRVALVFALIAVTYPMLRNFQLVPLDWILAQAESYSPDRAQSLGFRFNNEQILLERAAEKDLFGWGGWGRNLIRHSETGQILSIPDGRWIIVFGTFGWVGYIAEFGLLALPVFLLSRYMRADLAGRISPHAVPLTLMLAITLIDMLLNATLIPFTWMLAGAVLGHLEKVRAGDPLRAPLTHPPVIGSAPVATGRRTIL
ncbi:hypothetical protein [Oceaniovalibus sp. ACAM 378]|uniref:hypothetical protein n=1 Tax=Oceaniovalibus sp. ACAM 378 TaxID=2599923 RepID=UPI0011D35068|nr:hypothetical protein [Oceaniovalibus sp. ACAM 378]TYB89844.1 hypothetical protein FQ320_06925 [Oceaniovalibus sp. ACAM 378]